MWLSKLQAGTEVETSDEAWVLEAREDEVFAEVDDKGLGSVEHEKADTRDRMIDHTAVVVYTGFTTTPL